ncbi:hypothetical protein DPMN_006829 [Dreissena polymorpha]|uniref:Uncharacterized protein n=1 Tax=Dreissena polymorpha TaxID=45954 RepID=A0A9D4RXU0_DREPO|nr:hypothetical protein DPMN_006829 [Dreissena polymorpha]
MDTFQIVLDGLRALGHNVSVVASASSTCQGVLRQGDYIMANSDYRKYGEPDGY